MTIKELILKNECQELVFKGKCHDCGQETEVVTSLENNEVIMEGGAVYSVDQPCSRPDGIYVKCLDCYHKQPALSKFRKTEIYSRVVGYLRPVKQWNKGKQAEWGKRVKYDEKKAIKAAEGK